MASQECYLKEYINCSGSGGGGFVGVKRLRTASLSRGDSLHEHLSNESDAKYWCHKSCVSSYTSKSHIQYHVSKTSVCDAPQAKRSRRSEHDVFIFQEHCFLCGKTCEERDPKHPERWRPVSYCRTADRGKSQKTFKDVILDTCDQRNDEWGNLNKLGNTTESDDNVKLQCISFIASCYGHQNESDMTSLRYLVWTNKMANHKLNSAPELRVLPPTSEAFEHHVHRAHLQAAIWRSALDADPPDLSPLQYGWAMNAETNKLEPISLAPDVSPAPESILRMIKCGCSSSQPCSTTRCSCSTARISCSVFCACHGDNDCRNPQTTSAREEENEEFDEDEDADAGSL